MGMHPDCAKDHVSVLTLRITIRGQARVVSVLIAKALIRIKRARLRSSEARELTDRVRAGRVRFLESWPGSRSD